MTDDDLCFTDATDLAELIRSRQISAVEIVEAHLRRIEAVDPLINSVVTLMADMALTAARSADDDIRRNEATGPLHGVPFSVKDSIDTAGVATQRGSRLFAGHLPTADATAVSRMKNAGAISLMKTNVPEFSMWWETDNRLTGRTNNPWDLGRTPGGSSGGEAAAIAAGLSPVGLGSDVGISVRGPAHLTGIVALKPTHGRIPCTGLFPGAPAKMWHIGPMARSVRDVATAYRVLNGADGRDGYAIYAPDTSVGDRPRLDPPVRIGWLTEPGFGPVAQEVSAAVEGAAAVLAKSGCEIEPVRIPILEELDCVTLAADFFAEILPMVRSVAAGHEDDLAPNGRRTLDRREPTFLEYVEATNRLERLKAAFAGYFQRYDVLLCPVVPFTAPLHGQSTYRVDGEEVPTAQMMRATLPFNLTGLPALSVPFCFGSDGSLPVGVQVVGRWFDENLLLHLGYLIEAAGTVRGRRPPLSNSRFS